VLAGTTEALYNQGMMLYELCRYQEAIASYTKALELQPSTPIF